MSLSLRAAAREAPDRIAWIDEEDSHTYSSLLPRLSRAAGSLLARGAAGGERGALAAFTATIDPTTLLKIYACVELGVPFLPVHPKLTPREKGRLLGGARPSFIWEGSLSGRGDPPAGMNALPEIPDDGRPLAVLYTSGSSAGPKGVVLGRAAFVASAAASARNLGWEEEDRWLLSLPLAHVGGLSIVTRSLLARRTLVLCPSADPARIAGAIDRHRVTLFSAVPAQIERLLDLSPRWKPPSHLRAVLIGGGPVAEPILREGRSRGLPLLPTYGMTESCSQVATWPYGRAAPERAAVKPLPGIDLRVRAGRIAVRGPVLFSSYFPEGGRGGKVDREGWFETGDRGVFDREGLLHIYGREDEVIVTGGENVGPREVEEALRSYPGVRDAAVFGVEDEAFGEIVAAAVVWREGAVRDPAPLAAHLAERLAPFRRPRWIASLGALPETPSGKVDRPALRRAAAAKLLPLSYR